MVLCFLLQTTAHGAVDGSFRGSVCQAENLAAASIFDDLAGEELRDMGNIMLALQANLLGLGRDVLDADLIKSELLVGEKCLFCPDGMHFFISGDGMKELPAGYISVKCKVRGEGDALKTYYAVFFAAKDEKYFPMEIYKEAEWKRWEDLQRTLDLTGRAPPKRREEDSLAITEQADIFGIINGWWDSKMASGGVFKYKLTELTRRRVGKLFAMYNAGRTGKRPTQMPVTSVRQPFDPGKFNFNKVSENEVIIRGLDLAGTRADVLANVNPLFIGQVLIVPEPERDHPQYFISQAASAALESLRRIGRRSYKVVYNSVGATASVNHLHLQAFDYPDTSLPVELAEKKLIFEKDGVSLWEMPDWLLRTFVITGEDQEAVREQLLKLTSVLQKMDQPLNIVFTYDKPRYSVYVYPRKFQSPGRMGELIGFLEASGEMLVMPIEGFTSAEGSVEAYEKMTEAEIAEEVAAAGIDQDTFNGILEKVRAPDEVDEMTELARSAGEWISRPLLEKNYTLITCGDLYRDDREYENDIKEYGSVFNLERVKPVRPGTAVDRILELVAGKGLDPENVVVQLPADFSDARYEGLLAKLGEKAPGIRFMVIETEGLKALRSGSLRASSRRDMYAMMLLARKIDKDTPRSSKLYRLLRFFVGIHLGDVEGKAGLLDDYVEALKRNEMALIVKTVLSWMPVRRADAPDPGIVSRTLMSA